MKLWNALWRSELTEDIPLGTPRSLTSSLMPPPPAPPLLLPPVSLSVAESLSLPWLFAVAAESDVFFLVGVKAVLLEFLETLREGGV